MSLRITDIDSDILLSVVEHVFLPPELPQEAPTEDDERSTNAALCNFLIQAARTFSPGLSPVQQSLWTRMTKMMETIYRTARAPLVEADLVGVLSDLTVGDVFAMHVRAQNAGVVVRMFIDHIRFEMFEVSPQASVVMSTTGKLLCSYPGPAVQVSREVFSNKHFLQELSSFLIQMDVDILDSAATTFKAGSTVREVRESAHPKYISELLVGILRGFGQPASVDRITKRIADEVLWEDAYKPWRRSPLWLVIRVALQTSLDGNMYKSFMLTFYAYILDICIQKSFPSETLYFMRVKMARRLSKLGPTVSDLIYQAVYSAAKNAEALLQKRWTSFQKSQSVSMAWLPQELDVSDVAITLNNSRPHLIDALHSTSHSYSSEPFIPSDSLRLTDMSNFGFLSGGLLTAVVKDGQHIALADFELTVERNLDHWVDTHQHDDNAPDVVASCIEQYYASAMEIYGSDPEDNSVMILTIMDLWTALDKLTTEQCPLLRSYSPENPRDFLHPLLLHRSGSLQRAMHIEEYILRRHQEAFYQTSIFSDKATESSFAVQYFRTSQRLQQIKVEITQHAQEERNQKHAELDSLNEQWKSLMNKAADMIHLGEDGSGKTHRKIWCQKCQTEKAANELNISVHEWPLPRATLQAQLVIFELSPPRAFSTWRGITYKILCDIGMPDASDSVDQPKLLLDAFSALQHWIVCHPYHRITIGSTTKSFCQTHYEIIQIPADKSDVLVNNGLSFKLFDREAESWAARPFFGSTIAHLCTPLIPVSSPYENIHSFVAGTRHTPNEVIAAQADCPTELSPHEYMAFCGLRSGPRLQWLSIARELSSPSLSFRREEVHTLITQAAWQLGPLSDGVREWHIDLEIASFGWTLLHELECLLGRIEANWLEEVTIRTIALLTSRLLSSARDSGVCQRAYKLLQRSRNVAYKWINELGSKLDVTEDETSRTSLRQRRCTLAATCFSTYDVSLEHVPRILSSDDDIATAVHCAIIVHDNASSMLEDDPSHHPVRLHNRHFRLLHFLEPRLRALVLSNPSGFDQGLVSLWPRFRRQTSSNWTVLPGLNRQWICCLAEGGQEVHYDLLLGQLLIGGKPLGILPQEIMEHSTYAIILGRRVLDVVPSEIPEMEFMTRSNVSGHQIFFSLRDEELTLQTRRPGDPQLLQFVPRKVFVGDFPKTFVDDCVHWLDLDTGEVEFRPVESPWTPDPSNWRLNIGNDGTWFRKISGDSAAPVDLIDIRSGTFQMIARLLTPLESSEHIIITCTKQALEASLNRLHLVFFVNEDSELECRSMPGYVIDENQSCGTLFGLKNRLVLRPSKGSSEMPRRVVIPQGDVDFELSLDGDFANVSIDTGTTRHVHWHEYTIDTDLGRLTGNVSLHSKLYQCYLHALTSHRLPDPLLGHTGTEEALDMLQSATFLSFQRLGKDEAKLLDMISDLTPIRTYYPPHLKSMVTVSWTDLPILSQHHDFHLAVLSILNHAHAMETLYDDPNVFEVSPHDASLLKRAASRNRVYYPYDLQSLRHSSASVPKDVPYKSRDVADKRSAELSAYQTSCSVRNGQPHFTWKWYSSKLWNEMQPWGSLGPAEMTISLRYSRYWLSFNTAKDWFEIYKICQETLNCDPHVSKITLAFSLSAASFSRANYSDIVPLILIFATDMRFRGIIPPLPSHYELSDGIYPDQARLANLMSQFALPLEQTPAQTMEVRGVAYHQVSKERRRQYDSSISKITLTTAQSLVRWPDSCWDLPSEWFDTQGCWGAVDAYLQSIFQNITFKAHIDRLQTVISSYKFAVHPSTPYVFSPRFSAGSHKAISPSLTEVLKSRAKNIQSPSYKQFDIAIPTIGTQSEPTSHGEDSLRCLIHELQQSQESLLQIYGEELNKSYGDLQGKGTSFLVQRSVSQEDLLKYRDLCSKMKDMMFSKLSEVIAPSKKIGKVLMLISTEGT